MGMMDALKKKIKAAAAVAAEVMSSPCCGEDERAGKKSKIKHLAAKMKKIMKKNKAEIKQSKGWRKPEAKKAGLRIRGGRK